MRFILGLGVLLLLPHTVSAGPGALEGEFVDPKGRSLHVRATKDGFDVALPDKTTAAATLKKRTLHFQITSCRGAAGALQSTPSTTTRAETLRISARLGRMALTGLGTHWFRVEASRWWQLDSRTRRDLTGPFQSLHRHKDRKKPFEAFYAQKYAGTPVSRRHALAEWSFDRLPQDEVIALLCLYAKMRADTVWQYVKTIHWIGDGGVLLFEPTGSQKALRSALEAKTFGDWWMASKGRPWGVRSRFRGVQLHFRGSDSDVVNVHIDFVNPGDPPGRVTTWWQERGWAWRHYIVDERGWSKNHTPKRLLREVRGSGLTVFVPTLPKKATAAKRPSPKR